MFEKRFHALILAAMTAAVDLSTFSRSRRLSILPLSSVIKAPTDYVALISERVITAPHPQPHPSRGRSRLNRCPIVPSPNFGQNFGAIFIEALSNKLCYFLLFDATVSFEISAEYQNKVLIAF